MTAEEAAFRCKTSIEKTEISSKQIKNDILKQITQIALSLMQKNLEALHTGTLQSIPSIVQQCTEHERHVTWLKESIENEMKTDKQENTGVFSKEISSAPQKKSSSKFKKKKNNSNKLIVDSKILKKILKEKEDQTIEERPSL